MGLAPFEYCILKQVDGSNGLSSQCRDQCRISGSKSIGRLCQSAAALFYDTSCFPQPRTPELRHRDRIAKLQNIVREVFSRVEAGIIMNEASNKAKRIANFLPKN